MTKNRYKFTFGDRKLTLTTEKDNLHMEEVERLAREKYDAIKAKLPKADDITLAILLAVNCLSIQLERERDMAQLEAELQTLKSPLGHHLSQTSLFEEEHD